MSHFLSEQNNVAVFIAFVHQQGWKWIIIQKLIYCGIPGYPCIAHFTIESPLPHVRILAINNYYGLITDILITFISVLRI